MGNCLSCGEKPTNQASTPRVVRHTKPSTSGPVKAHSAKTRSTPSHRPADSVIDTDKPSDSNAQAPARGSMSIELQSVSSMEEISRVFSPMKEHLKLDGKCLGDMDFSDTVFDPTYKRVRASEDRPRGLLSKAEEERRARLATRNFRGEGIDYIRTGIRRKHRRDISY